MKRNSELKVSPMLGIVFFLLCIALVLSIALRAKSSNYDTGKISSPQLQEQEFENGTDDLQIKEPENEEPQLTPEKQAEKETDIYPDSSHLTAALKGSEIMLVMQGDPYIEPGAFAVDDRIGIIGEYEVYGTDKIDTGAAGDYLVEYTLKSENALARISRTVRVVPKENFETNTSGVPVMMYHCVYTASAPPASLNSNYILDTKLEKQLAWLKENSYYFPSFSELRAYIDGKISLPAKSIILTFDDADLGFLQYGRALLEKYQIPATTFIIGIFDAESRIKANPSRYLSYESHSYDMHRGGGHIGLGGIISAMSLEQIQADLAKEIDIIKSRDAFAYPYGDTTNDARQAIRNLDILCSFTTAHGRVKPGDDPTKLSRVRVHGNYNLDGFIWSIS